MTKGYIDDPELLKKLNESEEPRSTGYINDPALLEKLNSGSVQTVTEPPKEGPIIPAVGAVGAIPAIPTGYNAGAVREVAQPILDTLGLKQTADIYKQHKILAPAVEALGLSTIGVPPIATFNSALGVVDKLKAGNEAAKIIQAETSTGNKLPSGRTTTMQPYWDLRDYFRDIGRPELYDDVMKPAFESGKNDAVVKALKNHPEVQQLAKINPEAAAKLNAYESAIPSTTQRVGRVLAPVGKAALNVAGKALAPIGMGLEAKQAYDQYQAGDYTGAGLSALGALSMTTPAGILAQPGLYMMQQANQNFRQQTPQQQRESTMDALSGTAPGMAGEYFPQYSTEDNISKAIRKKAAERVLGPVAPR